MTLRGYFSISLYFMTSVLYIAATILSSQRCNAKGVDGKWCPSCEKRGPRKFTFKIELATPVKDLLPLPVNSPHSPLNLLITTNWAEDLAHVPELTFGKPVARDSDTEKETAFIIAKINHLNQRDPDGFMKALLMHRSDLRGLPYLLGKDCRHETKHAQLFSEVVQLIHEDLILSKGARLSTETYWKGQHRDRFSHDSEKIRKEANATDVDRAMVAAFMQIFGAKEQAYRVGLAGFLARIKHADAARALAKLALFAPEEQVRAVALDGLKSRSSKDYAEVLMEGFRYPLSMVARRAADAVVTLQCKDRLADLVEVLERPDPRLPKKQMIGGKETTFVSDVVRVNHHRNCLLCHAPANVKGIPTGVLTAPVPLPDRGLQRGGYGNEGSPDIFVRIDVTYLRQDFSLMMPVHDAKPWPEMQRFDFFVRTRMVSADEAKAREKQLAQQPSATHAAALNALCELVGYAPVSPTPQAWRRLLKLP